MYVNIDLLYVHFCFILQLLRTHSHTNILEEELEQKELVKEIADMEFEQHCKGNYDTSIVVDVLGSMNSNKGWLYEINRYLLV